MSEERCRRSPSPKGCRKNCDHRKKCEDEIERLKCENARLEEELRKCREHCHELEEIIKDLENNLCVKPPPPSCDELWVPGEGGVVPTGAVPSGDKPPYYVARVRMDEDSLVPGKLTPDPGHHTCWVAWNNTEVKMDQYEVLVTSNCKWVPTTSDQPLPAKAVPGGYMKSGAGPCGGGEMETLYIGRAMYDTILTPGYVFEGSRELLHSKGYKNLRKTSYEILVFT